MTLSRNLFALILTCATVASLWVPTLTVPAQAEPVAVIAALA